MDQHHNAQTTRKRFDIEALAASILASSPPIRELTRRSVVDALKPALLQAIDAGHTPASLSAQLRKDGFRIGERTLTLWLNLTPSKPRSKTPRKRAATPAT